MDGTISSDHVIAKLIDMGFDFPIISEAIKIVGPSLEAAVEFILNGSCRNSNTAASSSRPSRNFDHVQQSSIREHLQSTDKLKREKTVSKSDVCVSRSREPFHAIDTTMELAPEELIEPFRFHQGKDIGPDWEKKAIHLLQKHFGYSSFKSFQMEAIAAWSAYQDCLVLAATGSGKSLCFQIPALLTGKVVVVISPLISLMHDQCLKLAKHGVSACFLGSGQLDSGVEQKAMRGVYNIIYVCPETVLRLIKPLRSLAETCGIALFAIDEVHCVSKWGHDFRPDYRRLSILRENFGAKNLTSLSYDIPIMALTATATTRVREDILDSLCMSKETKTVLTSFFRPNLRFSVKHPSSYQNDFQELINVYTRKNRSDRKKCDSDCGKYEGYGMSEDKLNNIQEESFSENDDDDAGSLEMAERSTALYGKRMSVEYLEDESDLFQGVDDFDVSCGEFYGQSSAVDLEVRGLSEIYEYPSRKSEGRVELEQGHTGEGLTIVYVPTRKETVSISKFLCKFGVKAAAYNAKLPKSHLRQVHKEFHENALEVVVATIAFGMGIDKLNVRRIIHYGWPQSLEAYYQEAGRAGRDGNLADCVLYAKLLSIPSLLPSQRSEEQTRQAYKMLSDCFRYAMNTSSCRAKALVEYFGEEFSRDKCQLCDVCINGPPVMLNLKAEANAFMHVISHYGQTKLAGRQYGHVISRFYKQESFMEKPSLKTVVSSIRDKFPNFVAIDMLWWRGFARILEDRGFIQEGDGKIHVQIKFPEPTEVGLEFLQNQSNEAFYVYPGADMLLAAEKKESRPYSSFSEWGKGWADPEIRRQRLERIRSPRMRRRKSRKRGSDSNSVRGRLAQKLSKQKR